MPIKLKSVGGGEITIDAPNTASNYAVTLPASNATVLSSDSTLDATKLSGAVPASSLANATGRLIGYQVFTASGTYTKATNNPSFVIVEVVGGGGGGGGSFNNSSGAGGGAGGYAREKILASLLSASETVTVGAGGNGGNNANSGSSGNTSSFGAFCSATGGAGGANGTGVSIVAGGVGGTATGGDLNVTGMAGLAGINQTTVGVKTSGHGGNSMLGVGGRPISGTTSSNGIAGENGGGGSGAGATGLTGGAGGAGIVIVWEYA